MQNQKYHLNNQQNHGCCVIEDDVTIWGQVGTNSGITIGSNSTILGQTC